MLESPARSVRLRALHAAGALLAVGSLLAASGCSLLGLAEDTPVAVGGTVTTTATPDATPSAEPTAAAKPDEKKAERSPKAGKLRGVDYTQARQLVTDGAILVDLRQKEDYQLAHAAGTVNVPVSKVRSVSAKWPKRKPVVLYSRHESVSVTIGEYLAQRGHRAVYYLEGGQIAWEGDVAGDLVDLKVVRKTPVTPVVAYYYVPGDLTWGKVRPTVEKWRKQYDGKVEFEAKPIYFMPMIPVEGLQPTGVLFVVLSPKGDVNMIAGDESVVTAAWAYINSAVEGKSRPPASLYKGDSPTW